MQGFYEKLRDESDIFIKMNTNLIFPAHFHRNIEVALIKRGGYEITLSGKKYTVTDGSVVVVDNYEVHSYDRLLDEYQESEASVVIFPSAYIEGFNFSRKYKSFSSPVISDAALCSELIEITEKYLTRGGAISREGSELFFALLSEKAEFKEKNTTDEDALIRKILVYIEENFKKDISRYMIARELGYTEAHISRVFHNFIGKGISEYINGMRLSYIDSMRLSGAQRGVLELISEAGFKSQQTYYRARRREKG